jgi:hypothetical protein
VQPHKAGQAGGVAEGHPGEVENDPVAAFDQLADRVLELIAGADVQLPDDIDDALSDRMHRELGAAVHHHALTLLPSAMCAPRVLPLFRARSYCTAADPLSLRREPERHCGPVR